MSPPPDDDGPGGYGKPPKSRQFKPGRSGNPLGRPLKRPQIADLIESSLGAPCTVRLGGRKQQVSALAAMAVSALASGKAPDWSLILTLVKLAGLTREEELVQRPVVRSGVFLVSSCEHMQLSTEEFVGLRQAHPQLFMVRDPRP